MVPAKCRYADSESIPRTYYIIGCLRSRDDELPTTVYVCLYLCKYLIRTFRGNISRDFFVDRYPERT
jgi:hypothetical protein